MDLITWNEIQFAPLTDLMQSQAVLSVTEGLRKPGDGVPTPTSTKPFPLRPSALTSNSTSSTSQTDTTAHLETASEDDNSGHSSCSSADDDAGFLVRSYDKLRWAVPVHKQARIHLIGDITNEHIETTAGCGKTLITAKRPRRRRQTFDHSQKAEEGTTNKPRRNAGR